MNRAYSLDLQKKRNRGIIVTVLIGTMIFFCFSISKYTGFVLGICMAMAILFFELLLLKSFLNQVIKFKMTEVVNEVICSFGISFFLSGIFRAGSVNVNNLAKVLLTISGAGVLFFLFMLFDKVVRKVDETKTDKIYLLLSVSVFVLDFVFFFDLPLEVFLNNSNEFTFSFWDLLQSLLFYASGGIVVLKILSFLPRRILLVIIGFFTAINIGIYIQYMFFNRYIGRISGARFWWKEHTVYSLINLGIWIALIIVLLIVSFDIKKQVVLWFINAVVFALLFVSLVASFVKAPKEAFGHKQFYLSAEEQFSIGKEENAVVLIADAVDNSVIKELLEEDETFFDEFKDFTLYTNTCSVYDLTHESVPQMLYGYTYTKESNQMIPFLQRLKSNDYRVLMFGVFAAEQTGDIDNYVASDGTKEILKIDYKKISKNILLTAAFQALPCVLKSTTKPEYIDFDNCIQYAGNKNEISSDNEEFLNALKLDYNEYADKCFIYQHIDGAHFPVDNYKYETVYCLEIFKEYINQMKELGAYDNSSIIIASDHGVHDDGDGVEYPTAATPMFMVKKKNEQHSKIKLSSAPMYYADFQADILDSTGLYSAETDENIFGKPSWEYGEEEKRTRVWFDSGFHNQRVRKYTFTGDTKELERVVKEGEYEEVDSVAIDLKKIAVENAP